MLHRVKVAKRHLAEMCTILREPKGSHKKTLTGMRGSACADGMCAHANYVWRCFRSAEVRSAAREVCKSGTSVSRSRCIVLCVSMIDATRRERAHIHNTCASPASSPAWVAPGGGLSLPFASPSQDLTKSASFLGRCCSSADAVISSRS